MSVVFLCWVLSWALGFLVVQNAPFQLLIFRAHCQTLNLEQVLVSYLGMGLMVAWSRAEEVHEADVSRRPAPRTSPGLSELRERKP